LLIGKKKVGVFSSREEQEKHSRRWEKKREDSFCLAHREVSALPTRVLKEGALSKALKEGFRHGGEAVS